MVAALLMAGPTASGKSGLAIQLAQEFGGTVVNADSMQVYRDLRVLSARPSPEEEASVPHLMFGHVDACVNYSVGLWLADAGRAIAQIRGQGRLPVICGGTGMYFKALTQGLSPIPPVPDDVRARVRAEGEGVPAGELHARLAALDPAMAARLRPSDPQRILRALEVFEATGRSLATYQGARGAPLLELADCIAVFLAPERAKVMAAIDTRFDGMLRAGALDEVAALAARGLDTALPCMRAHGVPHLAAHLRGELSLIEAAERGKADTRAYAKRQFTFARNQLGGFAQVQLEDARALIQGKLMF